MIKDITFLHPQFFWLLLLLPLAMLWHMHNKQHEQATLKVSTLSGLKIEPTLAIRLRPVLFVVRMLALAVLIVALARPRQLDLNSRTVTTQGIDIVMAMDISASMLSRDLKPNRLEALKKVAEDFVDQRPNDRMGLVVYAAESYTKTPPTTDHDILKKAIRSIKYEGNILKDGTGIGTGLATAINRLKDSKARSKVIILLTDGENNSGSITPEMAADIANKFDLKLYTIGIGSTGNAEQPTEEKRADGSFVFKYGPVKIDEDLMKSMAAKTEGRYFRATDNNSLKKIYNEINKLETSEIQDKRYYNYIELFRPLLWLALGLVVAEYIARKTVYRSFI